MTYAINPRKGNNYRTAEKPTNKSYVKARQLIVGGLFAFIGKKI